ncbi:hypothetical protein ACEWY4_013147 [Coilia grayii]|uniref:Uncharacterized protein n=1 Tax=Coilia grayii TaxID=363190 RepID=A0ABD1JVJ7_9TELE
MNVFKPGHKVKARRLGFFLILCFHLARAPPPGPCKHSVTQGHLLTLRKLSDVCYIKAVFPQILDLLKTHFQYVSNSDNGRYVTALENVIYNIYTYKCIPEINEEREDNSEKFIAHYCTSPQESLQKVHSVLSMYMNLMAESRELTDWNCEDEYAVDHSGSNDVHLHTEGTTNCLPTSESFVPTSKQPDLTLSPLTTKAPERSFQPQSTAVTEVWSPPPECTAGDDHTDISQSKGPKGHSVSHAVPLTGPTVKPVPASDLVKKKNNLNKE